MIVLRVLAIPGNTALLIAWIGVGIEAMTSFIRPRPSDWVLILGIITLCALNVFLIVRDRLK